MNYNKMVLKLKVGDRVKLISLGEGHIFPDWRDNFNNTGIIYETTDKYEDSGESKYDVRWDGRKGKVSSTSGQLTDEHLKKLNVSTKLEDMKEKILG